MNPQPAFAAVDWGTSSFRLWLLTAAGAVTAERRSSDGMTSLKPADFSEVLETQLAAAGAPADLPAVLCGMVGARQGWKEAGYLDVPTRLEAIADNAVSPPGTSRRTFILPGLAERERTRADVMRGEETQLLGAFAMQGESADGTYCMPGTHSKWVNVEGGRVTGFATFMTGELFAVIARHSILAHSIGEAETDVGSADFAEAVAEAYERPAALTNRLFSVRGGQLLLGTTPEAAADRLSGLLIGAELAGSGSARAGASVRLIGAGRLAALYRTAFAAIGVDCEEIDADRAVRAGLTLAAATLGLVHQERPAP